MSIPRLVEPNHIQANLLLRDGPFNQHEGGGGLEDSVLEGTGQEVLVDLPDRNQRRRPK
jgi:hypothetical protein